MTAPALTAVANWAELSSEDRCAARAFLDHAETADPFQEPTFCGEGALGGGLAEHFFVFQHNARVALVGYAVENFALGRHFPSVRSLIFPKGPVVQDVSALAAGLQAIEKWARERGFVYVDAQPQWTDDTIAGLGAPADALGWIRFEPPEPAATLKVDLRRSPDALLAACDKGTRYEIRRAEKVGITVRRAGSDADHARYYDCYRMTSGRKGFVAIDRANFLTLMARMAREPLRGALLLAEKGGDLLGGIVVLRAGPCLHYAYGASTERPDLRKLPIGYLLQWRAIEWAREIGLTGYDFGGYTATPQNTTAQFKKGFGGTLVQIAPMHRRILRRSLYGSAIGLKNLKSLGKRVPLLRML